MDLNLISTAKGLAYGHLTVLINDRIVHLDEAAHSIDHDVIHY